MRETWRDINWILFWVVITCRDVTQYWGRGSVVVSWWPNSSRRYGGKFKVTFSQLWMLAETQQCGLYLSSDTVSQTWLRPSVALKVLLRFVASRLFAGQNRNFMHGNRAETTSDRLGLEDTQSSARLGSRETLTIIAGITYHFIKLMSYQSNSIMWV